MNEKARKRRQSCQDVLVGLGKVLVLFGLPALKEAIGTDLYKGSPSKRLPYHKKWGER